MSNRISRCNSKQNRNEYASEIAVLPNTTRVHPEDYIVYHMAYTIIHLTISLISFSVLHNNAFCA